MSIEVKNLRFCYGARPVIGDVSFSAQAGELLAVLGPNGVGKSTLFRCLLGFLTPVSGEILVDGKPLGTYSRRELARKIAYIPQSHAPAFDHTVLDCVLMGMTAQMGLFEQPGEAQRDKAMQMLRELGIEKLSDRGCMHISGGERQLMLLARALVQDASMLIMDEPTANLDYGNSCRVMERVRALSEKGYTIIFSTHDPNQAFSHATKVLALKDGGVMAVGAPETALTQEVLSELYGIAVVRCTAQTAFGSRTICMPVPEGKEAR